MVLHVLVLLQLFLQDGDFHRRVVREGSSQLLVECVVLVGTASVLMRYMLASSPGYATDLRAPEAAAAAAATASGIDGDDEESQRSHLLHASDSSVRHCRWCKVPQPIRSKHCRACNLCVLNFDHHCFWIGTCVGRNNHLAFWWFLLAMSAEICWAHKLVRSMFHSAPTLDEWVWQNLLTIVSIVPLSFFALMVVGLLIFNTYTICTNQTQYEITEGPDLYYLKDVPENVFPFDEGIVQNVKNFCWVHPFVRRPDPVWHMPPVEHWAEQRLRWNWFNNKYYSCC